MTTLNVQAVITAVDRLSPGLAAMGGRIAAMQNRFNSAATAAASFGQGAGIAAAGLITAVTSGQYALDKALRQFQVVGSATDKQRQEMRSLADQVGVKLGMPQLDLIVGATELLQAGLEANDLLGKGSDGVTMLEDMASAAKVAGESIASMAADLVILAKSFNMPWATGQDRLESMRQLQGLAVVAPRYSPDSPTEHVRALAEFGAIAEQLGISPREASALQSTLSLAGFTGSRGGMAWKTILQRMLNPTPAAQAQMMAGGFNYGRIFKTDLSGLTADTFINALGMGGVHAEKARHAINRHIRSGVAQGDDLNLLKWKADLEDAISSSLGLKKGDAQNRRIIKKGIDNITATTQGGLDVVAFLEELQKMPVAAFKDLAGLHHATKMAVMNTQEALRQYREIYTRAEREAPFAIREGLKVKLEGFAASVDQLGSAWTAFKNSLSTTGTFGAVLDKIAAALRGLSEMEPGRLDMLSKAITGLGIGLAGLAGASAGVWVLAKLGAIMTGPLGKLIAAGGLAALFGGFEQQQFNINGAIQNGPSPIMELLGELATTGSELVGLIDDIGKAVAEMGGIEIAGSSLVLGLTLMSATLRDIRQSIEFFRNFQFTPRENSGLMDFLKPFDAQEYARQKRGGPLPGDGERSWWNPLPDRLPAPYDDWWSRFKSWWSADPQQLGGNVEGLGNSAVVDRLNSPLQVTLSEPPVARLEGAGTVDVRVRVEGPGELTGVSAADDGKNVSLKTGGGMSDTNR
ncbi:phage tail tape measure protein [Hyphomicrobium sp. CS1GBMeth3]|uniref:phage tail tape measure protein n=1 Tax=Hyphomicrobium sp. CS1GBMeth3 TaxID=1892845 RepID=UPI0009310E97|nr:phage tail tape measure protein [Hyphomicrobium sp. CS1GBMeth3]